MPTNTRVFDWLVQQGQGGEKRGKGRVEGQVGERRKEKDPVRWKSHFLVT